MRQSIKTYLKVILNLLTALIILLLCIFLLPRCIIFFMPFIIGWIISLIASPVVRFFEERMKIRRKGASVIVIVAVLAVVILLVYVIVARLVKEGINFVNELPLLWDSIMAEFNEVGANLEGLFNKLPVDTQKTLDNIGSEMGTYFGGIIESVGTPTFEAVGNVAKQLPDIFLGVIMCILSAYFFVADKSYMANIMKKYVPGSVLYRFDLIRRSFRNAVGGYFKAQFKIECWIYVMLVIGLFVLKVRYAPLVALGIAFLDFLPVFGTGTFDTTRQSLKILAAGFNKFRRIRPEDLAVVEEYEQEVENSYKRQLKSAEEEERELEEAARIKIEEPLIIRKIISKKK